MKTPRQYKVGDIISGAYLRQNGDDMIGLITQIEDGNTNYPTYFVSIWWSNSREEICTNETIDSWIQEYNAKHYQVIE